MCSAIRYTRRWRRRAHRCGVSGSTVRNAGGYDCIAAGTTVTPEREAEAQFVPPYLISGQSLAVDTTRLPNVKSIDDLAVALDDQALLRRTAAAQEEREQQGALRGIRRKWLGNPYTDQSLTVHRPARAWRLSQH
jgi:hypothetical protein